MLVPTGEAAEWYVSADSGVDEDSCGKARSTACRRLETAFRFARPGDVLRLDSASSAYRLPCLHPASHLDHGFTVRALTVVSVDNFSRPTISCETASADAAFTSRRYEGRGASVIRRQVQHKCVVMKCFPAFKVDSRSPASSNVDNGCRRILRQNAWVRRCTVIVFFTFKVESRSSK